MNEKLHSRFGASSSDRWMSCPQSIALIEKAPPAPPSKYADEGTEAHGWLEYVLRKEILGEKVKAPKKVSREMENFVQDAVNWVRENYMPELGDILEVETKVSLAWIHEEMFGTLDIAIIRPGGRLTIADFKYGQGKVVEPEENSQLLYYALGKAKEHDFDFEDVEIVVIQPRASHPKGPVRSWVCEVSTLRTWEVLFAKAVKRVLAPNPKLFAGDHCQFCPAIPICPALESKAIQTAQAVFDDNLEMGNLPTLPDPKDLSADQVGKVLKAARELETWVKGVYAYAEGLLERGGKIEGFKLVNKQARRKWANELEVRKYYFDSHGIDAFDLKSPRQIETLFKSDVSMDCVSVSSGTTIVPESDKRPAIDNIREVFNQPIEGGEHGKEESKKENGKKESVKKVRAKKEKAGEEIDLGF